MAARSKTVTNNFDSVGEFIEYVTDTNKKPRAGLHCDSNNPERGGKFFWSESLTDAARLATAGWPEGAQKVAKHRDALAGFIAAAAAAKSSRWDWDVTGHFVDVGRYLSGEPETFGAEFNDGDSVQGKVVSIRFNSCISGSVSVETICARGVAVLVAVDLLESLGIRCEIVVGSASVQSYPGACGNDRSISKLEWNVVVKRAGEPVDLDRLAFAVAHPSFQRRLFFRADELGGYSPSGSKPAPFSDYGKRPGTIEVDEVLTSTGVSHESLKASVLDIVAKCGVEFTEEQAEQLIASC